MGRIWHKIRFWLFWLVLLAYAVVVMSAVSLDSGSMTCRMIRVEVKDSLLYRFVERQEIGARLLGEDAKILGNRLDLINTDVIEKEVENHPFVRKAEAYTTSDGLLKVEITQRRPLIRLIYRDGRQMYIDSEAILVPAREIKPAHTLVCNGYLPDPGILRTAAPIDSVRNASWYRELFGLAAFIRDDPFWNAQFEQLYVRSDLEMELIPRLGAHMILLGPVQGYEEKLHKLMVLYREGLNRVGWNQYEWINLKFDKQVICTKR